MRLALRGTAIKLQYRIVNDIPSSPRDDSRAQAGGDEGRDRYQTLLDSIDEGYCVIEMLAEPDGGWNDYRFVETNRVFEQQSGLHDAVGRRARELMPVVEQDWFERYGRVADTGESARFTTEAVSLGRWLDICAFRVGAPGDKHVGVLFTDITERLKIQGAMAMSEIRYRRLFESAHDGILILDTDRHQITDVNPFLLELLSYPREYFIGKELWEIGVFADKAESQTAMTKVQQEGSIRFENKPLEDRRGRQHPVEIVANIYQENGHRVIQCNIRDISDRTRFEQERSALLANEHALRQEAEDANRAKDTFLATLSHELRTPLTAILGWAVLLRRGANDEKTVNEAADVIARNARVQTQLIEDVLDVSRIVSGKLRLEMKRCDLTKIIEDAVASVQSAADVKQIDIKVEIVTGADASFGDPGRIQQVIWNLLSNAIKFSPKVGDIDVLVERVNSMTRISIADQGEGISPDFLPHVFERFRQSDGSSTRKHGGLGLGLSIVKNLIELHGGTVNVQSAGQGKGATFIIDLPIRAIADAALVGSTDADPAAPAEGADAGGAPALVRLDGLRVLVVDDEPDARNVIKRSLEQAGATVAAADSGAAALVLLETGKPHLIVSDISMPAMDGYELMKQIRAMGAGYNGRELPSIALTAYARTEDRRRALGAGFQMHVAKPVDPNELTEVVASLAGRTGLD